MLHITNGDSAANLIKQTGLPGEILPWRDMLYEGPVLASLSSSELLDVRAEFIAQWNGWVTKDEVLAQFISRDDALTNFKKYSVIILWFEHDLYDQLQLIQILNWFQQQNLDTTKLSLICIDNFLGVESFRGLGQLNTEQMISLYEIRQPISTEQLILAKLAWEAFCSPNPTAIEEFIKRDVSTLPFLSNAFTRHLEEFPCVFNGLSRTQKQILSFVEKGINTFSEIFRTNMLSEDYFFPGDIDVWNYLYQLYSSDNPLLTGVDSQLFAFPWQCQTKEEFLEQKVQLTSTGYSVLEGQADWITINGIDSWKGGVHLHGKTHLWRSDEQNKKLVYI